MRNTLYIGIAAGLVLVLAGYGALRHFEGASTSQIASVAGVVVSEGTNAIVPSEGSEITVTPSGVHVDAEVISHSAPPPEGSVEYRNEKYGFSFYHAPESVVKEYDEGGGALTVTLENYEKGRGMQVFIVPYGEKTISEDRFKRDVPSGVRENAEDTSLDGVRAVTFNSSDTFLGPTREIWVIRNGYLYEITTFSGVGRWFTPIIQSWKFL